jgi:hypothetical protein
VDNNIYYLENSILYIKKYGPTRKIKESLIKSKKSKKIKNIVYHRHNFIKNQLKINVKYNKYIPIFPEKLVFLAIDLDGIGIIVDNKNNVEIKIGYVGQFNNISVNIFWHYALIISLYDCYIIVDNINSIIWKQIQYPFNVIKSDNKSFNNFIWTTRMHKFLCNFAKTQVLTFLICNKLMNTLKIPYWITFNIISIFVKN